MDDRLEPDVDFEQRDILRYWNAHLSLTERYIRCLNAFQAVFRAESLLFLEKFLSYLSKKKQKAGTFTSEAVQVFLRYLLITDILNAPDYIQYISDKSLLSEECVCPSMRKSLHSNLSFFEIEGIVKKCSQLGISANLSWMYDLNHQCFKDETEDNYLIFLQARLFGRRNYSYLPEYLELTSTTRTFYPQKIKDIQQTLKTVLTEVDEERRTYYDRLEKNRRN
jgi:hypothetical protein